MSAQEEETSRDRFLPLRLKLAVVTGAVLTILFLGSMAIVYNMEAQVVRNQSLASGAALARFVAVHSAVPALDQNWLPLKLFVQDGKARGGFDYLVITDHDRVVQAATDPNLIGKPYELPADLAVLQQMGDMTASSFDERGVPLYFFDTPILFQKTAVGRVYLGLDQSGQTRVLRATVSLMAGLGLLAVLAVIGLSQVFGMLILRPVRLLKRAIIDFGTGDFDRRISEARRDEIGELYIAFNRMADQVQQGESRLAPQQAVTAMPIAITNSLPDAIVADATIRVNVA